MIYYPTTQYMPDQDKMFENVASEHLKNLLENNQLGSFESIWSLTTEWFEQPNQRRQGWSGVIQYVLQQKDQSSTNQNPQIHANTSASLMVFIKRQENHNTRSLAHPVRGEPTFYREYKNICKLQQLQLPTLSPVYFGERRQKNKHQAILITKALTNHVNLFEWYQQNPTEAERQRITQHIANWVIKLHSHRLCHYCLYPNHIFVSLNPSDPHPIKVIDLEKLRMLPTKRWRAYKELKCFLRHSASLPEQDRHQLLDLYFQHYPQLQKTKQQLLDYLAHQIAKVRQ